MTENMKVLVYSNDYPESGLSILREHFTVVQNRHPDFEAENVTETNKELLELIPGSSALVWMSPNPIQTELLIAAGPQLKMVATCSAGYNNCNIMELKTRGIKLSDAANVVSSIVSEVAVALIFEAAKRFAVHLRPYRRVDWEIGPEQPGQEISGSTVGIVGLGSIGQATIKRLSGFEVEKFYYTGPREKPEASNFNAQFTSLDHLLKRSDFIVFSARLTSETYRMINNQNIKKMKRTAVLIIVSHGDLDDLDILILH
ncbi:glyoxylate reductase/hydroxypyruvate reductase-like [Melitaea cinxia]|uniref:glyoxylate reductase/hydroxypyruvate reductase-like n=1 Tax=Melitaea cinxia TaxID=113334 RepID=UPI001E2701C6|nr:glyoxylate reductase/hydroxypyruvate reductase-like [Melitaea cinxia]